MKHAGAATLTFAAAIAVAPPRPAQSHPSFAGSWSADIAGSTASGMALPLKATCTFQPGGDSIVVNRSTVGEAGALDNRLLVRPDGPPTHSTVFVFAGSGNGADEKVDMDAAIVAHWVHDTLAVAMTSELQGIRVEQSIRWSLSTDGSVLHEHREGTADGNSIGVQDLVYRRKE